jgi:hypothetical protein
MVGEPTTQPKSVYDIGPQDQSMQTTTTVITFASYANTYEAPAIVSDADKRKAEERERQRVKRMHELWKMDRRTANQRRHP